MTASEFDSRRNAANRHIVRDIGHHQTIRHDYDIIADSYRTNHFRPCAKPHVVANARGSTVDHHARGQSAIGADPGGSDKYPVPTVDHQARPNFGPRVNERSRVHRGHSLKNMGDDPQDLADDRDAKATDPMAKSVGENGREPNV